MQYKYSFIQREGIPAEYIERDKQREMENGMFDIGKKIIDHYPYKSEIIESHGQTVYTLELMVTSAEKFQRAYESIGQMVSAHSPALAHEVFRILKEMQSPDVAKDSQ